MTLIPILRLLTIFFLMQGPKLNKDIPINEASGVHSGHIQTTHYSYEGGAASGKIYFEINHTGGWNIP